MISSWPILSITIFLPICGDIFAFFISGYKDEKKIEKVNQQIKLVSLWTSLMTFFISLLLWINFDFQKKSFQFQEYSEWITSLGIVYHLGVDGISLPFILLTTFLVPVCILCSWNSIKHRIKEFMISFLILETFVIGTFCSLDLIVFYIFFEAVLILSLIHI